MFRAPWLLCDMWHYTAQLFVCQRLLQKKIAVRTFFAWLARNIVRVPFVYQWVIEVRLNLSVRAFSSLFRRESA